MAMHAIQHYNLLRIMKYDNTLCINYSFVFVYEDDISMDV